MHAAAATTTCPGCQSPLDPSASYFTAFGEVCYDCNGKIEAAEMAVRAREEAEQRSGSFEGNLVNGGTIVGVLTMLAAAVWFFGGLAAGVIFFYPPILFVVGLIGFLKGLVAR